MATIKKIWSGFVSTIACVMIVALVGFAVFGWIGLQAGSFNCGLKDGVPYVEAQKYQVATPSVPKTRWEKIKDVFN